MDMKCWFEFKLFNYVRRMKAYERHEMRIHSLVECNRSWVSAAWMQVMHNKCINVMLWKSIWQFLVSATSNDVMEAIRAKISKNFKYSSAELTSVCPWMRCKVTEGMTADTEMTSLTLCLSHVSDKNSCQIGGKLKTRTKVLVSAGYDVKDGQDLRSEQWQW